MKRTVLAIAALGLFFFAQVAQADWTSARRLTWNTGNSIRPALVIGPGGWIYLVWADDMHLNYEIYFKRSTDCGRTWTTVQRLTRTPGNSSYPAVVLDHSRNLHLVWADDSPGLPQICYKKSTDAGTTWTIVQRITWGTSSGAWSPGIAVDPYDNLHLVYGDVLGVNSRKSTDGGATWTTAQIFGVGVAPPAMDIAVDSSGNLYLVWTDSPDYKHVYQIYFQKSTDGGASWTTTQKITSTTVRSIYPDIAVDSSGNLHLVWNYGNVGEGGTLIYYMKSSDQGGSWLTYKVLTPGGQYHPPAITADSLGSVHVVWDNFKSIFYRKSTNAGATWLETKEIGSTAGDSAFPAIALHPSGNPHVVWQDNTLGNYEIYYTRFVQ